MGKIIRKKDVVYIIVLVYTVLFVMYALLKKTQRRTNICFPDFNCVRFCCFNKTTCNDTFIKKNFNGTGIQAKLVALSNGSYTSDKSDDYYRILYEKPCDEMEKFDDKWEFSYSGAISYDHHITDSYCLQDDAVKNGTKTKWNLHVCKTNFNFHRMLQYFASSMSAVLMVITFVVYACLKDLKTVAGKSTMLFSLGLALSYTGVGLITLQVTWILYVAVPMIATGFALSITWMSVMIFDIWLTFRNFQLSLDDTKRFKFYCSYAFGVTTLGLLFLVGGFLEIPIFRKFAQHISIGIFVLYAATGVIDLILLIWSAISIFAISKTLNVAEHKKLQQEKDRFWICVQIFAIMLITRPIEIDSWSVYYALNSRIVVEVIKLFSAIVIAVILLLKEDVRSTLFDRYKAFYDMENE